MDTSEAKSRPILEDIKSYLQTERPKLLPKSPIAAAIDYTLSNGEALRRYTEDGDLEIDNNGAERSLRPIVVGRGNWLFYGSDKGGRTGAVLSTLIATCKRLRIEPFAYLRDLFTRISAHPHYRLDDRLPDLWQAAQSAIQPYTTVAFPTASTSYPCIRRTGTLFQGGVEPPQCAPEVAHSTGGVKVPFRFNVNL